jgi:small subunit ribosomal protein S21
MLIIDARDSDSIDKALKKYKKKFDSTKTVRQLRARQHFTKPSVTRRNEIKKAVYIEKLNKQED